jgi:hypothetical protein
MRQLFSKSFWLEGGATSQQFQNTASKVDKWMIRIAIAMIPVGILCLIFFFTHAAAAIVELFKDFK